MHEYEGNHHFLRIFLRIQIERQQAVPQTKNSRSMMSKPDDDKRILSDGFIPSVHDVICGRDQDSFYHGKKMESLVNEKASFALRKELCCSGSDLH